MKVRSRRKKARQERLLLTAAVMGGIILLGILLPRFFSMIASTALQPAHSFSVWINESERAFPSYIRSRRVLDARIIELETSLAKYAGAAASRSYIIEENKRLRGLLSVEQPTRTAAAVVARPAELPYDVLQIDRGANDGIMIGAPVFINERVAIGLIEHVAQDYSLVRLISSPGFESTVFIGGPNVIATLEGQGGGSARVRVPQGIELAVGNTVALPALNAAVLGRVEVIENIPTQAEQYGYLTLPIALQHLHTVAVGAPSEIITDVALIEALLQDSLQSPLRFEGLATSTFATSTAPAATSSSEQQ